MRAPAYPGEHLFRLKLTACPSEKSCLFTVIDHLYLQSQVSESIRTSVSRISSPSFLLPVPDVLTSDVSSPSAVHSTTSHSTRVVPSADVRPPFCRLIRPNRESSISSSNHGAPRCSTPCVGLNSACALLGSTKILVGFCAGSSSGCGRFGFLVTFLTVGSSGSSSPRSASRSKSSYSRLPRVKLIKFSSCRVVWHHCDSWVPQYPQNCRCVLLSKGETNVRRMERCVSSGKKANVVLWYHEYGTRSQAVKGAARCLPVKKVGSDRAIQTKRQAGRCSEPLLKGTYYCCCCYRRRPALALWKSAESQRCTCSCRRRKIRAANP